WFTFILFKFPALVVKDRDDVFDDAVKHLNSLDNTTHFVSFPQRSIPINVQDQFQKPIVMTSYTWEDLLEERHHNLYWWLISRPSGCSNYYKCLHRTHGAIRDSVLSDNRIQQYLNTEEWSKIEKVLDEIAHRIPSYNSTYKLKISGLPFLQLILKIYDGIFVNCAITSHPRLIGGLTEQLNSGLLLKDLFLQLTKQAPVVLLPNHKSYMDFLHITYIFFHNCLPLPAVAGGDNFKALGTTITNYLKGTGAFLVRRNAKNKKDIDSKVYFDVLRSYIESVLVGGENPIEFFLEGTRSRTGQVLKPKTGLLSMIVDAFLNEKIHEIYLLPVALNYSRTLEEQLYVKEITPGIDSHKPKETVGNLLSAYKRLTSRKYGKAYVRICTPLSLKEFHNFWSKNSNKQGGPGDVLKQFTSDLALYISHQQIINTPLTAFNLLSLSLLHLMHFKELAKNQSPGLDGRVIDLKTCQVITHAKALSGLIRHVHPYFVDNPLSIREFVYELGLDRDNIVKISSDRSLISLCKNSLTVQTLISYANPTFHLLVTTAIMLSSKLIASHTSTGATKSKLDHQFTRKVLRHDFLYNPITLELDERCAIEGIKKLHDCDNQASVMSQQQLISYLHYYLKSYSKLCSHLCAKKVEDEFALSSDGQSFRERCLLDGYCISKDLLKNMATTLCDQGVGKIETRSITYDNEKEDQPKRNRMRTEDIFVISNRQNLSKFNDSLCNLVSSIYTSLDQGEPLIREFIAIQEQRIFQLYIIQSSRSPFRWFGTLFIDSGIYMGAIVRITINIADSYPDSPCPELYFSPVPYHPLVEPSTGQLDTKNAFPCWDGKNRHRLYHLLAYAKRVLHSPDIYFQSIDNWLDEASRDDQGHTIDVPTGDNVTKESNVRPSISSRLRDNSRISQAFLNPNHTLEAIELYKTDNESFRQKASEFVYECCQKVYDLPDDPDDSDDEHAIIFTPWDPAIHEPLRAKLLNFKQSGQYNLYASYDKSSNSVNFVPGSSSWENAK
ncbi:Dihydroxyacetone phosphate acyltransferase, partial [Fragariocoptes setiger]